MQIGKTSTQILALAESLLLIGDRTLSVIRGLRLLRSTLPRYAYENLFLDLTLDLRDAGKRAVVIHKQRVRFLVEDAGVVTSPIWGEGDQVRDFEVEGAKLLGSRSEGPRQVQMLSLDRSPTMNTMATIYGRRTIFDGFTHGQEYFELVVERPTKRLSIHVLFPRRRPPTEAYLRTPDGSGQKLPIRLGRDRRARVRWSLANPLPQTVYSIRWSW